MKLKLNSKSKRSFYSELTTKLLISVTLAGISLVIGCKKFIDVGVPKTQLITTEVFKDGTTATAAITAIYSQMLSLTPFTRLSGLSSDELVNYSTTTYYLNAYKNQLLITDASSLRSLLWTPGYKYIYQANSIIEGLEQSSPLDPKIVAQLKGEAKFIRAYWHFYLTNFYGEIPVVTTTDYTTNVNLPRSKQDAIYQQIISDLKDAQALLGTNYVDATSTNTSVDRIRPNKWVATALLARAYLYNAQYKEAEEQASSIITNTGVYEILTNIDNVFLKNSKEAIWQLPPLPGSSYDTEEGRFFILDTSPENTSNVSLNADLVNAFEQGDKRKTSWVGSIAAGGKTYYFPFKYKIKNVASTQESSTMLRVAEQYLIRAEAKIQQGDIAGGIDDLNVLRDRARATASSAVPNPLPSIPSTLSKEEALKAVAHERQVELFTESDRWFDLKRTKTIDIVMGAPGNASQRKMGSWQPHQQLYPIAQAEIDYSTNLTQNPQY